VGAGIIDADYQGVVHVLLINHSDGPFDVKQGDRVAQLIVQRIATPAVQEVLETDLVSAATVRGALGFGSTGV
jgi:dUTP pyrophosphatase